MAKKDKTPSIRFLGFNDPWEQRKLGEVVRITMGQSPFSSNYTNNPEDYILVQGNADMKNGKVIPRVWTTQVTKTAEKGDIILTVRAPVGDVGKTDYNIVMGRGVAGLKGNEFIFQTLQKKKQENYWKSFSSGSTFDSINSSEIKQTEINIPNEILQEKIGGLLILFDKYITLHQRLYFHLKFWFFNFIL